jgi:DNA-binding CsgD family transcriptional regulator
MNQTRTTLEHGDVVDMGEASEAVEVRNVVRRVAASASSDAYAARTSGHWGDNARVVGATPIESHREQRRVADELEGAFLHAITQALVAWQPLDGGSEPLLRDLAQVLGVSAGVLWLPNGARLVGAASWSAAGVDGRALEKTVDVGRVVRGVGLAGSAWERCEPLQQTMATARESSKGQASVVGGLLPALAIPARMQDEVLGVIELYLPLRHRDQLVIPPLTAASHLLGSLLDRWRIQMTKVKLTKRELELLALASHGMNSSKIAEQLWLSPSTVKTHFEHIRVKLKAPDRAAAVAQGLRDGMIG